MARVKQPPHIAAAMQKFKFEVAGELGIPLNEYDNGDLTSRECGRIGGTMVKHLIELGQQVLVANYEAQERRKAIKLVHSRKSQSSFTMPMGANGAHLLPVASMAY